MGCNKHPNSGNYLNPDSKSSECWGCYEEEQGGFYNFEGKEIISYDSVPPYFLRLRVVDSHIVYIDAFILKGGKYVRTGRPIQEQFMSRASVRWKNLIKHLDSTGTLDMGRC